jgi:DNA-binding CsgD family transcriptional regulator
VQESWQHLLATPGFDPSALSHRELEVLQLIARGQSDRQISEHLFVSPRTVNAHIRNMLAKTHTSNRTELTVWAIEQGKVNPPR